MKASWWDPSLGFSTFLQPISKYQALAVFHDLKEIINTELHEGPALLDLGWGGRTEAWWSGERKYRVSVSASRREGLSSAFREYAKSRTAVL